MELKVFNTLPAGLRRPLLVAAILLGWLAAALADGPDREFIKNINREFSTTANGMVSLYNKYGKVNVNTWQNNSVKIDITIVVNTNDQREADRIFDRIQVNFANTAGYVKAETVISEDNSGKWWGWNWGGNSCQDFKINYEVWMPVGNQLDLKNKYGNAYVSALNGKLTAEIKYGDLRTEAINNDVELYMGYGKATMVKANNLNGQVSYGGLTIGEARDMQLDSKYSEFKVDRANSLRITSKYDDFSLGNIDDLRLQTKYANVRAQDVRTAFLTAQYTDVKFVNVASVIDADLTYGSLKIESLGRNFSEATVNGKYTDVEMFVERGANFRFDAQGNYTGLRYPSGATIRRRDDSGSRETVEGFVGDANAKGVVKARLNYGDFVLR